MKKIWTCPSCNQDFAFNVLQRVDHEEECSKQKEEEEYNKAETKREEEGYQKLRKNFKCDKCKNEFEFSTIEALKHRKSCMVDN